MKVTDFRAILLDYSSLLSSRGAPSASIRILQLAQCLPTKSTLKISGLVSMLTDEIPFEEREGPSDKVELLAQDLSALLPVLSRFATAAKIQPLREFLDFVTIFGAMELRLFLENMNGVLGDPPDIVVFYVERLQARYKDPEKFKDLFERLEADKRVKKPEAIGIAQAFSQYARSGSKADALSSIWDKHKHYAESAAAGSAMAGKSAA